MVKKYYIILINLLLILYVGFQGILKNSSLILLVAMLLIILSLELLDLIFFEKSKGVFLLIAFILALMSSYYISSDSLILASIILTIYFMQYFQTIIPSIIVFLFLLVPAYKLNITLEYIFFNTFFAVVIFIFFTGKERIIFLENDRYEKSEEIKTLKHIIKQNEDYRKQAEETLRLQERNTLSIAMHDKIGHAVSGAILQLEASKIVLNSNKDEGINLLQNTIDLLRTGVDEIRVILRETKPPSEKLGLSKIKLILEEKLRNTGFNYRLNYSGNLEEITLKQWNLITEAIRELSTNSLKYSKGNLIKVNIEILNTFVKTGVSDNGIGAEKIKPGIGLKSLEEKILECNGKLIIDSSYGFSTVVLLQKEVI